MKRIQDVVNFNQMPLPDSEGKCHIPVVRLCNDPFRVCIPECDHITSSFVYYTI